MCYDFIFVVMVSDVCCIFIPECIRIHYSRLRNLTKQKLDFFKKPLTLGVGCWRCDTIIEIICVGIMIADAIGHNYIR